MSNVKAIIRLATGNVGFYDNLTRIHLTIASPIGKVLKGMNTTNLQNGVRCKTIEVLEGSLYDDVVEEEPVPPVVEEEIPPVEETEKEPVVEEKVEEEVAEEPAAEPKKTTRKKSSKKVKEEQSSTEESK